MELEAQFDAERRLREIDLLAQDKRLKAEQLENRQLQTRLWALLAACAVLFCALLLLLYRRLRKHNLLLASHNAQLQTQSERDPLTGLSNRRHFQEAMHHLADDGRLSGTVFLIDIDHFKCINDRYGHAAGDAVLVELATRLRKVLREPDLVVRWGGEEFLVVVQSQHADVVAALAQRLLDCIGEQPFTRIDEGHRGLLHQGSTNSTRTRIAVTASIGFTTFPLQPSGLTLNWERAIDLVDVVMYLAKSHGRNRAYGVNSVLARHEDELVRIVPALEGAWNDGRIDMTTLHGPRQVPV